jgi:hypothetical protein
MLFVTIVVITWKVIIEAFSHDSDLQLNEPYSMVFEFCFIDNMLKS